MVSRYPHTGVFSWRLTSAYNTTTGIVTPGTLTTLGVACRVVPNSTRYVVTDNGDRIGYQYGVFTAPVTATITDGARFTWDGDTYRVVSFHNYQKHSVFQVSK